MILPHLVFDSLYKFALKSHEMSELPIYTTREYAARTGPKPVVHPHGPGYAMHPELSRPAVGYIVSTVTTPALFIGPPIALAAANYAIIEKDVPEEERPGYWQMFSSALTGTWGGNFSGLI